MSRLGLRSLATILAVIATSAGAQEAPQPGTPEDTRLAWAENLPIGRSVRVITAEEIWRSNARNLPDLLQREAGVWTTWDWSERR